MTERFS